MIVFLYIIAAIVTLFILLAAIAPKKYDVNRKIQINKPVSEVFEYIKYVKNQDHWGPWNSRDPEMKQTEFGIDGTVGFINRWESDHKQVGHGEQEIINIEEGSALETELRFLKPWKSISQGYLRTTDIGEGKTEVTWGFHGVSKIPMNIMMLFFNMDKAVGKDFEEGLANLKKVLES